MCKRKFLAFTMIFVVSVTNKWWKRAKTSLYVLLNGTTTAELKFSIKCSNVKSFTILGGKCQIYQFLQLLKSLDGLHWIYSPQPTSVSLLCQQNKFGKNLSRCETISTTYIHLIWSEWWGDITLTNKSESVFLYHVPSLRSS